MTYEYEYRMKRDVDCWSSCDDSMAAVLLESGEGWEVRKRRVGPWSTFDPDNNHQPAWDDNTVERVARRLWVDACSEYSYEWEPNADIFREQARGILSVL